MTHNGDPLFARSGNAEVGREFEDLLTVYLDELNETGFIDPEQILSDHPDLGPALLKDLGTFVQLHSGDNTAEEPLGTLGDYTLRRQIGRGGMGVVYEAWQGSMDRQVALKVLPTGLAADEKTFTRFMREAKTAGKLDHPNVVAVHAAGFDDNTPYYAMEYVEGATLGQVLGEIREAETEAETVFGHKDGAGYFETLARAFADVADGLQHAHSKGVIHRDIKPSNLILDGEGRLRILDFGLAHLEGQESLTLSGDVLGTPSYMSPEQARAKKAPVDHRTDIYSLGATMYEALTLKPPFKGKDHQNTISQIVTSAPEAPHKLNPRIPQDLETIVLKCLRKDPGNRYGTAEALAQDLRRFVRGDPIEARRQSGLEKLGKRLWLYKGIVTATVLILALIISTLAVSNALVTRARDEARYDLYVSNMGRANEAWERSNMNRFGELLERHVPAEPDDPDLRGWEWYYLDGLYRDDGVTLDRDAGKVRSLALTPDETLLASGSGDGKLIVWDMRDMPTTTRLDERQLEAGIRAVAWSADAERLATTGVDGVLRTWDWDGESLEEPTTLRDEELGSAYFPAFSPDGRCLALASVSGHESTLAILDAATLERVRTPQRVPVKLHFLSWASDSRDSRFLAGSGFSSERFSGIVMIWDVESWEPEPRVFEAGVGSASCVAWSPPDDQWVACALSDGRIRLWNPTTDATRTIRAHVGGVRTVTWSPDGSRLASSGVDGTVKVWDLSENDQPLRVFRGHTESVKSLLWSRKSDVLLSGGMGSKVKLWHPTQTQGARVLRGRFPFSWSPDGELLAAGAEVRWSVVVFDLAANETVTTRFLDSGERFRSLAWNPEGHSLAVGTWEGRIKVWDTATWEKDPDFQAQTGVVASLAWHPDGRLLASAGWRHFRQSAQLWDGVTGERLDELPAEVIASTAVAWSPDGTWLAVASEIEGLVVWDLRRWEKLLEGPGRSVKCTSFSPDGKYLAAGFEAGALVLWDTEDWREVRNKPAHASDIEDLAWAPDGQRLATASRDHTVKIWDPVSGDEVLTLRGPNMFRDVSFSPDNRRLAAATGHSVMIWEAPGYPGEED